MFALSQPYLLFNVAVFFKLHFDMPLIIILICDITDALVNFIKY